MGKTLTPELIQMKCKTDKLASIKNLNLWGNDLEDISIIKEMPNIEICSLSLNKIHSLKDFPSLKKLAELYLRKNLITDLTEAKYLTYCPNLKVLWLWDNPIAEHPLYRQYIIKLLPNLVKLDNAAVTPEEKSEALKMNITEQDIASGSSQSQQQQQDDSSYHKQYERPKSVNAKPSQRDQQPRGISPSVQPSHQTPTQQTPPQHMHQAPQLQNPTQQPINSSHSQSNNVSGSNYRNENILCAVLALLKELDESGLELVKRDIERKLSQKKQGGM